LIATTETGSKYDIQVGETGELEAYRMSSYEGAYDLGIDHGYEGLMSDKIGVGLRMVFKSGVVTTPVTEVN